MSIENKIHEIFSQGDFHKISSDLLQMACGHRADLVQQRREAILRSVKDKITRNSLRRIPPTCENLFQSDSLSTAIDKHGGISKIFWPIKSQASASSRSAAQAGNHAQLITQYKNKMPAQGMQSFGPLNSNVNPAMAPAHGMPIYPYNMGEFPPAQGGFPFYGQAHVPNYRMPAQGPPFRPRGPRPQYNGAARPNRQAAARSGNAKRRS